MSPMLWYGRLTKEGGDMKLTIDRNVWLRGEGNGVSFLLREEMYVPRARVGRKRVKEDQ